MTATDIPTKPEVYMVKRIQIILVPCAPDIILFSVDIYNMGIDNLFGPNKCAVWATKPETQRKHIENHKISLREDTRMGLFVEVSHPFVWVHGVLVRASYHAHGASYCPAWKYITHLWVFYLTPIKCTV